MEILNISNAEKRSTSTAERVYGKLLDTDSVRFFRGNAYIKVCFICTEGLMIQVTYTEFLNFLPEI